MKFVILAVFIASTSAGVINQAPVSYANLPSATSYSNVYNPPILRSAPFYPSISPLAYNAAYNPYNPISTYAAPLTYGGYSHYAYNAPPVQPFVSPILRSAYIRSFPSYPFY